MPRGWSIRTSGMLKWYWAQAQRSRIVTSSKWNRARCVFWGHLYFVRQSSLVTSFGSSLLKRRELIEILFTKVEEGKMKQTFIRRFSRYCALSIHANRSCSCKLMYFFWLIGRLVSIPVRYNPLRGSRRWSWADQGWKIPERPADLVRNFHYLCLNV